MKLPSKEISLDLYRRMVLIRRFEEAVARVYRKGLIPGFVHLYIGEEAVAAGVTAHLNDDDFIGSTHRGHAHALTKGVPVREVMAELFGRSTGCSGGRGGSMHLYSARHGLPGTNGIVGEIAGLAADEAFYYLESPIKRVHSLPVPDPMAPPLERAMVPDKERVAAAVKEVMDQ